MNITLEQLKRLVIKYDATFGEYPESIYEGLNFYEFICEQLGVESEINRGPFFNTEYRNLLEKEHEHG